MDNDCKYGLHDWGESMNAFRTAMLLIRAPALGTAISLAHGAASPAPQNGITIPHVPPANSTASTQDTVPSFTLLLKAGPRNKDISEIRAGSQVWITITETNLTDHAIDCSGAYSDGIDLPDSYDVRDEDGRPAEKIARPHPELDAPEPYWSEIPAHASRVTEEQLNLIYKFDRPGKYTVQVSRPDPNFLDANGKPSIIKSNVITITITG